MGGGALWGWTSGIAAPLVVFTALAARRAAPAGSLTTTYRDPNVNPGVLAFGLLAMYGGPVLLVLNAFGLGFPTSFAVYLIAVLMCFVQALLIFVRLLQTAIQQGSEPNEESHV